MKSQARYFQTKDSGVHYAIFKNYSGGYNVRSAEDKFDLAAGLGNFEGNFDRLKEAKKWIVTQIARLERNL